MKYKCAKFSICLLVAVFAFSLALTLILPSTQNVAYATSQEAVLAPVADLASNAYAGASSILIARGDDKFLIPESYYLLNAEVAFGNYYKVSYADEEFYVEAHYVTPNLTQVDFAEGVSSSPSTLLTLKDDQSPIVGGVTIDNTYTIRLLGYSQDGASVYVKAQKEAVKLLGMVPIESFNSFLLAYHPIAQAERQAILDAIEKTPASGDMTPNTSLAVRIVLIIGITIPAVLIVLLLFKPNKDGYEKKIVSRKRKREDDYDYDRARTYQRDGYNSSRYPDER